MQSMKKEVLVRLLRGDLVHSRLIRIRRFLDNIDIHYIYFVQQDIDLAKGIYFLIIIARISVRLYIVRSRNNKI